MAALIKQLLQLVYDKVVQLLQAAPPGVLQISGVVGLALLVLGFYQGRDNNPNRGVAGARLREPGGAAGQPGGAAAPGPPAAEARRGPPAASPSAGHKAQPPKAPAPQTSNTPQGRAVAATLSGLKRVTVSLPGVVLAERSTVELQEAATVLPGAAELVKEVSRICDVFLIAHVEDDVGEAVVTGALEAEGLLGPGAGQVRPHRLLFCGTLDGKVSIVRQLEPELHIDGHAVTVEDLKRFMPQLLLVQQEGLSAGRPSAPNIGTAVSLPAYFGL